MPVQDLTPQLRTRLSRVERAVGVFVILATLLLMAGFAFYLYSTAQRKGWLKKHFNYFIFVDAGTGLREGNEVTLMGFPAGRITQVEAMAPDFTWGNVYVQFEIIEPYDGYIFTDSTVKVVAKGFLGERGLEITKVPLKEGMRPTYDVVRGEKDKVLSVKGVWDDKLGKYVPVRERPKGYGLKTQEAPAVTERAEALVAQVEAFLPNLTNQLSTIMSNLSSVTARADLVLADVRPILTNTAAITSNLKEPNGALGKWIIPPELNLQLTQTLATANLAVSNANLLLLQSKSTVSNTDSNVTKLATSLDQTLINLADLTSNLNAQVQVNSNLVSNVNGAIVQADTLMQGLKRHWLLRSAFKEKKPETPKKTSTTTRPKK